MDQMKRNNVVVKGKKRDGLSNGECDEFVTISKHELKRLYRKIHEYQVLIDSFGKETLTHKGLIQINLD